MQFRGHKFGDDHRVVLHKFPGGCFIGCTEDRNTESLITWLFRASSQNQLTGFCRFLQSNEVSIQCCIILFSPLLVVVQTRHES